jgi:hypothetical protein
VFSSKIFESRFQANEVESRGRRKEYGTNGNNGADGKALWFSIFFHLFRALSL